MSKVSFEKLTRSMMMAGLVSITSMFVFVGCGSNSAQVIDEEAVPTTAEVDIESEVGDLETPTYETYTSADGWSVQYDPAYIQMSEGNGIVGFVYTDDCAGTCMVSISTLEDTTAEDARAEMVKGWGDTAEIDQYETKFSPQEKDGYWAYQAVAGEAGSGLYETAIAVDHNDKTILVECIEHMGGDEMMDMQVSDQLALIIDSMEFQ